MSGPGATAGDQGPYGEDYHGPPASAFLPFDHNDDVGGMFSANGGGGLMAPYSGITDYLQGFLDPAGLARHLDASMVGDDDAAVKRESAELLDVRHDVVGQHGAAAPLTPNSSVLSSTSSEVAGDQDDEPRRRSKGRAGRRVEKEEDEGEVEEEESAANQRSTAKKKTGAEKKPRGSRVAFMTKSEVDHLEDGYRWRKYGQKAVKHSSYPRSYYRCTAPRCGVKKLVERSHQDPSTVITTYEGQHTHPSPVAGHRGMMLMHQGAGAYSLAAPASAPGTFQHGVGARMYSQSVPMPLQPQQQQSFAEYYGLQDILPSVMGNRHGQC